MHTSPPSSVWSTRQHSPWSRYGRPGPVTPPPPGSLAFSVSEASTGCRFPSETRVELGLGEAGPHWPLSRSPPRSPRPPHPPSSLWCRRTWGRACCGAPIAPPGSYLARVRVQAAADPGLQEARLGPPPEPAALSPDAACRCGCSRLPVSVTELCQGEFHAGPQQAGPPPPALHVPPPTPILARGQEKAANFKSARRLRSCPELSTINHGASDFCSASEGGVGTPGSFCLLHSALGRVLITNRQGRSLALPLPPLPLPPLLTLPLSCPLRTLSRPSFLPLPMRPPLTLHTSLCSQVPWWPVVSLCTPHLSWGANWPGLFPLCL